MRNLMNRLKDVLDRAAKELVSDEDYHEFLAMAAAEVADRLGHDPEAPDEFGVLISREWADPDEDAED